MTTNVICRIRKVLASDSRWSFKIDEENIGFIDDTGFDKIADRHMGAIICAGDGPLIEKWRDWFLTPILNMAVVPPVMRFDPNGDECSITISYITKPDGQIRFSSGWYYDFGEDAKFTGSGAPYARDCYALNHCGRTAVETAGRHDPMTGGETKFVEIETLRSNLNKKPSSMQDVHTQFSARGMTMNIRTKKVEPINGNDPRGIAQALSAGTMSLSAPTGYGLHRWTQQETKDLHSALAELAKAEEAANK